MFDRFRGIPDADWLKLLKRSIHEPVIDGVSFPGFPDEGTQVLFTSHKWDAALDEAYAFFQIAKSAAARAGRPLGPQTRYLDFGVGWGRIARLFLKDLDAANIEGVDVTPEILVECQRIMPVGRYTLCRPRGTLEFAEERFDLVTAFSVFSHLSADNGKHWLRELHRVMKPGALLVVTTLSRNFLAICRDVSANPESSDWARGMAASVTQAYPDWKTRLAQWPDDELLFLSSGGGFDTMGPADYGWAMVPEGYARKQWKEWFEVVEFRDDPKVLPQAHLTLRRR